MSKRREQDTNRLRLVDGGRMADAAAGPSGASGRAQATGQASKGDLPVELTSFVGREREVDEVKRLLADQWMLTLTGPGGSGKTRLALAVAFEVVGSFEDGA
jgi:MoxR-like ATPase